MTVLPPPGLIGWVDPTELTEDWAVNADNLDRALGAAYDQCLMFLNNREPALDADGRVADRFWQAQVMQARAILRSGTAGSGDQLGGGDLTVTVFPMDWTVKNLLRPKRGHRRVI